MRALISGLLVLPAAAAAAVNFNTAQQSELQRLSGMSPAKAKAVIEHRHQNGPYRTWEDLEKVVDEKTLEKIKPHVAFNGPPYEPPPKPDKKAKKKQ